MSESGPGSVPGAPDTRFKKGQSGNPGGRTSEMAAKQREVKERALEYCRRAIDELVMLMDSSDPKIKLAASNAILDRGLGKPAQALIGDADSPLEMIQRVERAIVRPNPKD